MKRPLLSTLAQMFVENAGPPVVPAPGFYKYKRILRFKINVF
jgi:hypothetical protein